MRAILLAATLLMLSGCVGMAGPSATTVTQVQVQTVTVTSTPPAPATFLKLGTIYNHVSEQVEVRFQAYTLDSSGAQSTYGYQMKSVLVPGKANAAMIATDYPACDSKMEGLTVQIRERGAEESSWMRWPGIHCTGDAKSYDFTIQSSTEIVMGTDIQKPATPLRITFTMDNSGHELRVVSADGAASWSKLIASIPSGCTVKFQGTTPTQNGQPVSSGPVKAGDFLTVSATPGASCAYGLTYTDPANSYGPWTFTF